MPELEAGVLDFDTSALVKLVIREAESDALEQELRRWSDLATSAVTSIELSRAVARARSDSTAVVADEYTILGVLASLAEIPLSDEVRAAASSVGPGRAAHARRDPSRLSARARRQPRRGSHLRQQNAAGRP